MKHIMLPLQDADIAELKAGDSCMLTGPMYTLRDAGHMRLMEELKEQGSLPYDLEGATIFYAGPTAPNGLSPIAGVGPA